MRKSTSGAAGSWLPVADAFHSAALGDGNWIPALEALASATGSRSGELIGFGSDAALPFNVMTNADPDLVRFFAECGGADPAVNPRVRAGIGAPPLTVLAESDFITPDEQKVNRHYREFAFPFDMPFICLTNLERREDLVIGLAVARSQQEGHITGPQRRTFEAIAPHARAAVRTNIALAGQGNELLLGAMETLSFPACLCDQAGRVRAMTPTAEALVAEGRVLQLRHGRLRANHAQDSRTLAEAIAAAAHGDPRAPSLPRTVIVRGNGPDSGPMALEIIPLRRRDFELGFAPRVLVVATRGRASRRRKAAALLASHGLTAAETEVALQLACGRSPEEIAAARGVAVGTVRVQTKALYAKLGIHQRSELAARLSQL